MIEIVSNGPVGAVANPCVDNQRLRASRLLILYTIYSPKLSIAQIRLLIAALRIGLKQKLGTQGPSGKKQAT